MAADQHLHSSIQYALFQAAKVGHIELMREFIKAGGNPFALDSENHSAIYYAMIQDPKETFILLQELDESLEI